MKRSSSRSAGSGRTVHSNTAAAIHDSARNTSAFTPESDSVKAEGEVPRHSVFHPSDDTPPGESQRFIKNNRYFTICIYGLIMLVASAIIFKAIIDIEKTKAWFGQIAGVLSPFIFGALLAYILNPMVRVFYHGMELLLKESLNSASTKPSTRSSQS